MHLKVVRFYRRINKQKEKEILSNAVTWCNKAVTDGHILSDYLWVKLSVKLSETENRTVVIEVEMELVYKGYRGSIFQDEKFWRFVSIMTQVTTELYITASYYNFVFLLKPQFKYKEETNITIYHI